MVLSRQRLIRLTGRMHYLLVTVTPHDELLSVHRSIDIMVKVTQLRSISMPDGFRRHVASKVCEVCVIVISLNYALSAS